MQPRKTYSSNSRAENRRIDPTGSARRNRSRLCRYVERKGIGSAANDAALEIESLGRELTTLPTARHVQQLVERTMNAAFQCNTPVTFSSDYWLRLHPGSVSGVTPSSVSDISTMNARAPFPALTAFSLLVLALVLCGSPALADEALTYDANGNVQTRTLSGGTTTFNFDELDRVVRESGPATTQNFTYDANGNRKSDGSTAYTYTLNTDRVATINGVSVTMDAIGQITSERGYTFVWNQRAGQIKQAFLGGTLLATYWYDYKGRRSRKVTTAAAPQGAGTVLYIYDIYNRLQAEFDGAGNPALTYVWRDDIPVGIIVHGANEYVLYLETDHLNTPIAARNQSGKVVWRWEPNAFGANLPNEDPGNTGTKTTINLRFAGQYYDRESGLHNNWHRYYDPQLGRYMSPDLIGRLGGPNLYSYVNGNPLSYVDPEGLQRRPSGAPGIPLFPRIGPSLPPAYPQVGTTRAPIEVLWGTNSPGEISGRPFSGHAFDRMQERGIPPSVVINTLFVGRTSPGNLPNITQYFEPVNNVTVVVNSTTGNVVTVRNGPPSTTCQ